MLIDNTPGMKVVGEAGDRRDAVDLAAREKPDIILLDLDMGAESGLDFFPELFAAAGEARMLVLTGLRDTEIHRKAIRLGAMGVILKDRAAETLVKAIRKVQAGELWLDRATARSMLGEMSRANAAVTDDPEEAKIASLTPREREVITVIAEGLKNREVGERLFISELTVRHHLSSIFSKLDVSDRFELAIYAYRHGLARPPR
jgi:DNA-binding NarL/FixJ family response regulator